MEEFKITVTRNTIVKLATVVSIFIFVKKPEDLWMYTLILGGGMILGYISVFPFLRKYIIFQKPQISEMLKHIKPNLQLFIPVIAVSIFNVMDKIMLGNMSSMVQVGLYSNTEKLMRIPFGVITALGTVMLPHMSHMVVSGGKNESKKVIERSIIFVMFLGCGMAFGLAGMGQVFAPIFFGDEFVVCGTLIIFLSPTVISLAWANVIRMQYLIPNKMDKEFTASTIIGAVVNFIINYLCISRFGALGAIFGTLCAETALTFYQTYVVWKHLPIKKYLSETVVFAFFGLIMAVIIYLLGRFLGTNIWVLVIQFIVGASVYIVFSAFYLIKSKNPAIVDMRNIIVGVIQKRRLTAN